MPTPLACWLITLVTNILPLHIDRLQAPRIRQDLKEHLFAFFQGPIGVVRTKYCSLVDEHFHPRGLSDKTVTPCVVEPFDSTAGHTFLSFDSGIDPRKVHRVL